VNYDEISRNVFVNTRMARKPTKNKKKTNNVKTNARGKGITKKSQTQPKHQPTEETSNLSDLQSKMKQKLEGAQFRWINQKLYTSSGKDAQSLFQEQPDLFEVYHRGYRAQVSKWPSNPLDGIIKFVLSQRHDLVIADFGCGEAKLAQSVPQKVHSLDLVAQNEHVQACDMANVPLSNNSVDVVVFCLSLMGTNTLDFLKEAQRVLKPNGILKIAEVKSRFPENITQFIKLMAQLGFTLVSQDNANVMFIMFTFKLGVKQTAPKKLINFNFKPCLYKKR